MPITGSDKAPTVARLGVMRLGATRLDYYDPTVKVTINGVDRSGNMRISGVTINDYLDGTPNTMTCRVQGFTPSAGHEVKVALGQLDTAHMLFAGHILEVTQVYEELQANVAYDITCIDYTWLLDRTLVTATYTSESATTIAQDLISIYTSGFTSTGVESGLDTIDEITFTRTPVSDCLTQLAKRGGWYWVIDASKNLRFGSSLDDGTAMAVTDTNKASLRGLAWSTDWSQVKTRETVVGKSTAVLAPVQAGVDGWIPVADASVFGPVGTPSTGYVAGRKQAISFPRDESAMNPGVYCTMDSDTAAGASFFFVTVVGGTAADVKEAGTTAGRWLEIGGQIIFAGAMSGLDAGTSVQFSSVRAAGQPGAIAADIPAGAIVTLCDMLRPVNGDGFFSDIDIAVGETIACARTVNDTAAQTAMAAAFGGDGIHEETIEDGRLSYEEMGLRGEARLALVADPLVTARYVTRDQSTRTSRTVAFTLGAPTSLSGTFRIQQVTITELGQSATAFPLRQVEASSRRFSLEDLLRQIKGAA
jgi:hypothetical protein